MRFRIPIAILLPVWIAIAGQAQSQGIALPTSRDNALLSSSSPSEPPLSLDDAEKIALDANPDIQVAMRRVAMAKAHVPAAAALDDPAAMYRGWGCPSKSPGISTRLRTCSASARPSLEETSAN